MENSLTKDDSSKQETTISLESADLTHCKPYFAPQKSGGSIKALLSVLISTITLFGLWLVPVVGAISAVIAITLGHQSMQTRDADNHKVQSIAGLLCGYFSLLLAVQLTFIVVT